VNRRAFLYSSLAGAAAAGLPRRARAGAPAGAELRFIFVFNRGGWDPTRAFTDTFDHTSVDMEAAAEPAGAGGVSWVSHPDRPGVDAFFSAYHDQMLVINGILVRSIAHEICTMLAMTGSTSGLSPDWPAIIASATASDFTLPHLVLDGPSFPGELGVAVARSGLSGQLEALLSGDILAWSDTPAAGLSLPAQGAVDRYLLRRASARAAISRSAVDDALSAAFEEATAKAIALKDYRYVMDFTGGAALADQAQVAVSALSVGLSRCVTLGYPGTSGGGLGWDTHADNDAQQSALFEGLFLGLGQLMGLLRTTPGVITDTLADETVVVVLSEMGRTAQLNATAGKDHWPYTSAVLLGPGLTTDRVVGGLDDGYYGRDIDLTSGELDDTSGRNLSSAALGATLLALADVDPAAHIPDADPITGVLT